MLEILSQPWPWYVSGPLIGLMIPLLLIAGNKPFGVSSSLRHICAAALPKISDYFKYDWKSESWNLLFVFGISIGGLISATLLENQEAIAISSETKSDLNQLGITNFEGYVPEEIFGWEHLGQPSSLLLLIGGGLVIGFGTRYADGCTSGHSIMGISSLSWVSLVATICFFIGGLICTHFLLPLILA